MGSADLTPPSTPLYNILSPECRSLHFGSSKGSHYFDAILSQTWYRMNQSNKFQIRNSVPLKGLLGILCVKRVTLFCLFGIKDFGLLFFRRVLFLVGLKSLLSFNLCPSRRVLMGSMLHFDSSKSLQLLLQDYSAFHLGSKVHYNSS